MAIELAGGTREEIVMAPGLYIGPVSVTGKAITLHGTGATLTAPDDAAAALTIDGASRVFVVGLTIERAKNAGTAAGISTTGTLALLDVTIDVPTVAIELGGAAKISQSTFRGHAQVADAALIQLHDQLDATHVSITRSLFTGTNAISAGIHGGAVVTSSLFVGTGDYAFETGGNAATSRISFSTLVDSAVRATVNTAQQPSLSVDDSILFSTTGGDVAIGGGASFHYDLAPAGVTGDHVIATTAPGFVASDDFHLAAGSPAIDAAAPEAGTGVDFDGDPRPSGAARDIGAFESQ
jgi:hypothetical protein